MCRSCFKFTHTRCLAACLPTSSSGLTNPETFVNRFAYMYATRRIIFIHAGKRALDGRSPENIPKESSPRLLSSKRTNGGRSEQWRRGRLRRFGIRAAFICDAAAQRAWLHALRRPRDDFCDLWQHADKGTHQGVEASASRRLRGQLLAPLAGIQPAEVRSPLRRMCHAPTRVLRTRRTP